MLATQDDLVCASQAHKPVILWHAAGVIGRGAADAFCHVHSIPALVAGCAVVLRTAKVQALLAHLRLRQHFGTLNVVEAAADAQRALAHGVIIEAGAELLASEALHATGVALRTEPCIILMWAYVGAVMVEGPEAWPCACDNALCISRLLTCTAQHGQPRLVHWPGSLGHPTLTVAQGRRPLYSMF